MSAKQTTLRGNTPLRIHPLQHPNFVAAMDPMAEVGATVEVVLDISSFNYLWQLVYAKYLVQGNRAEGSVPAHQQHYSLLVRTLLALEEASGPMVEPAKAEPTPINGQAPPSGKTKSKTKVKAAPEPSPVKTKTKLKVKTSSS